MSATSAIARRTLADSRVRTGAFGLFFLLYAYVQVVGYRHTYPTLADRVAFARGFGSNTTLRLFYGVPHDLLTVGGYTSWRVGGTASVFAGVWALLAAVRATRTEEEAGRQELVLAGVVSRTGAYLAALVAIGAGAVILWSALLLGLLAGHLAVSESAYLALAIVAPVPVFAGVGALAAQLAPTRRLALELATAMLAVAFLARIAADTSAGLGALRWATPLGWSEELRAFANPRPAVLLLPAFTGALLLAAAGTIASRRDIGRGVIHGRESSAPRRLLLSSPTALALRSELIGLAAWLAGTAAYALVIGLLSTTFSTANIPANVREQLDKLGASITTPAGALGVYFLLFVFAISLFACAQIAAVRRDEADQRLETLFSAAIGRRRWLAGRLLLASACAASIALTASVLAWAGAASKHAGIPLTRALEAGANCLPTALLFLALAALAFAVVPRASTGLSFGLVSVAFVWQLVGALLGTPHWLLELTPFQHVGLVPAEPFRARAAAAMLALATGAALAALALFERRDLAGA